MPAREFCLKLLREHNHDRYLACLYLPENIRHLAIALYAFDAEIIKISSSVSEPMTGEIRIQWWRDTIGSAGSGILSHNPLADNLLAEISEHKLPLASFDAYLQARIFDLYHDPMPDFGTLEGYCGETASVFIQLLTIAAKLEQDRTMSDICGHAGMVLALTDIIRALPHHTAQNRLYIPLELLDSVDFPLERWFAGDKTEKHMQVIANLIDVAEKHLTILQSLLEDHPQIKTDLSRILFPTALCMPYLRSARKMNRRIFDQILTISPLKKHWYLWRAAKS